jgi:hypothetical protein
MRRMVLPLPAASMPSNTMTSERSRILFERVSMASGACSFTSFFEYSVAVELAL